MSTPTTAGGSANPALVVSTPTTEAGEAKPPSTAAESTAPPEPEAQPEPVSPAEPPPTTPITSAPAVNGISASFAAGRVAFGATPELMADIDRRGVGGWIEDQLTRADPDPDVESRLPGSSPVKQSRERLRGTNFRPGISHAVVFRARYSRHQLFEMVASMWADHFNVYLDQRPLFNPDYQEKVIRPHAMGRFADLLLATAESEGMMFYLDNHLSDASKPAGINENYGRELLELHTVGVGNHSEADVVAAAKAMTGWTIRGNPGNFTFVDRMHANETVTVLGTTFPAAGKAQGEALLDHLAHHPATARMVATKICRRFVADDPPSDLVESAARVYLDNDTAIVPVLRHVLTSAAFGDSAGQKLRRPMEFVVAALRATDATLAARPERTLFAVLGEMGNRPWDWPPPNGFPDVAPYWADTSGFALRWSFAARLLHNRLDGITTDLGRLRGGAATADDYVVGLFARFGLSQPPPSDVEAILGAYGHGGGDSLSSLDDDVARDIAALVLCHPGFQLR